MSSAGAGPASGAETSPYDRAGAGHGSCADGEPDADADGARSDVDGGGPGASTAGGLPAGGSPVVVVMGVAGTGKTTVGRLLADRLGVPYAEADAFHPPANVAKMTAGTPLDDGDRVPWLDAIGQWAHERAGLGGVVSCSALKHRYRDRLRSAAPDLFFLHLTGDRALVTERMRSRRDHFMPVALLDSQFAALEPLEPGERGAEVPVTAEPEAVAERGLAELRAWAREFATASAPAPEPGPGTAPAADTDSGRVPAPAEPARAAART
jgi:gluconokinase